MQSKRAEWIDKTKTINIDNLIFLDESSVNLSYTRLYGRAKSNKRVKQGIKDCRFERQSILSTISINGEQNPMVFKGTLNSILFVEYLKNQLYPNINQDSILVLDNSSVHKSKLALDTLKDLGITYMFLPPYSPDYNPIELLWSKMKSFLRKAEARTTEKLFDAIKISLSKITLDDINNWFKHCGYKNNIY